MYIFIEGECHVPKTTFTSVANLTKNSPYVDKYIKVAWCLWPHFPNENETLYVQISNKHNNRRKYFEITNHKTCQCHVKNKSTAGYEELRKANIRELRNKPNNGKSTSPRKHIQRFSS